MLCDVTIYSPDFKKCKVHNRSRFYIHDNTITLSGFKFKHIADGKIARIDTSDNADGSFQLICKVLVSKSKSNCFGYQI